MIPFAPAATANPTALLPAPAAAPTALALPGTGADAAAENFTAALEQKMMALLIILLFRLPPTKHFSSPLLLLRQKILPRLLTAPRWNLSGMLRFAILQAMDLSVTEFTEKPVVIL